MTHVDGLAATNETLEELNTKANEPAAGPVRVCKILRVCCGSFSTGPCLSPVLCILLQLQSPLSLRKTGSAYCQVLRMYGDSGTERSRMAGRRWSRRKNSCNNVSPRRRHGCVGEVRIVWSYNHHARLSFLQDQLRVSCIRLTFLRPCGTSPSLPTWSPQSVLDHWRERVRVIVLQSVPEVRENW